MMPNAPFDPLPDARDRNEDEPDAAGNGRCP